MSTRRVPARLGAITAIAGAVLLLIGTMLHPMNADPNAPLAAFSEYATAGNWVTSHLTQFLGVALMLVGLVAAKCAIDEPPGDWIASLGLWFGASAMTVAAALQAVDGIALKRMVDLWWTAPAEQKSMAFLAALAVRQIEIGLASFAAMLFGATVVLYGLAFIRSRAFPIWVGWLGIIGGLGTLAGGLLAAYTGFSTIQMTVGLPFNLLVICWMIAVGLVLWRHSRQCSAN